MQIRCRICHKVWKDKIDDERLLEGTCKRCVAAGFEDKGQYVLFTLAEMLATCPKFKEEWDREVGQSAWRFLSGEPFEQELRRAYPALFS